MSSVGYFSASLDGEQVGNSIVVPVGGVLYADPSFCSLVNDRVRLERSGAWVVTATTISDQNQTIGATLEYLELAVKRGDGAETYEDIFQQATLTADQGNDNLVKGGIEASGTWPGLAGDLIAFRINRVVIGGGGPPEGRFNMSFTLRFYEDPVHNWGQWAGAAGGANLVDAEFPIPWTNVPVAIFGTINSDVTVNGTDVRINTAGDYDLTYALEYETTNGSATSYVVMRLYINDVQQTNDTITQNHYVRPTQVESRRFTTRKRLIKRLAKDDVIQVRALNKANVGTYLEAYLVAERLVALDTAFNPAPARYASYPVAAIGPDTFRFDATPTVSNNPGISIDQDGDFKCEEDGIYEFEACVAFQSSPTDGRDQIYRLEFFLDDPETLLQRSQKLIAGAASTYQANIGTTAIIATPLKQDDRVLLKWSRIEPPNVPGDGGPVVSSGNMVVRRIERAQAPQPPYDPGIPGAPMPPDSKNRRDTLGGEGRTDGYVRPFPEPPSLDEQRATLGGSGRPDRNA